MTSTTNKTQRDRPRWMAPAGARPEVMTTKAVATLSADEMLSICVEIVGTGERIPVVVRTVSPKSVAVMTGRGFPPRKLDGATVVRLVRQDNGADR